MKHQLQSFKVAFKGVWFTIKSESHMRFHLVAAFYVIVFSFFYNLSRAQWGVILLLSATIMTAEVFNTAVEELCNKSSEGYSPLIRIAKDVAAGAVLILSFAAVAIAFIFYFDLAKIAQIFSFFIANPALLILFVISLIISVLFIALGPMGITRIYHKIKRKGLSR